MKSFADMFFDVKIGCYTTGFISKPNKISAKMFVSIAYTYKYRIKKYAVNIVFPTITRIFETNSLLSDGIFQNNVNG